MWVYENTRPFNTRKTYESLYNIDKDAAIPTRYTWPNYQASRLLLSDELGTSAPTETVTQATNLDHVLIIDQAMRMTQMKNIYEPLDPSRVSRQYRNQGGAAVDLNDAYIGATDFLLRYYAFEYTP